MKKIKKSKKTSEIEFGDEKITLGASRLSGRISRLQSAVADLYIQIKSFVAFLDEGPQDLIPAFLDLPELESLWFSLLKQHSYMLYQWEFTLLPNFSVFTQLIGFYRFFLAGISEDPTVKLKLMEKGMEQGSVNAMIALGDIYIDKIRLREEVDFKQLFSKIDQFATLFLTPGHIIAADIYLATWATAVSIRTNFEEALFHLCMAEMLLQHSKRHISNAYHAADFKSASAAGEVFRSKDYDGFSIAQYIHANLKIYTDRTKQKLDLKPIADKAALALKDLKVCPIKVSKKIKLDLEEFFLQNLKENRLSPVVAYLLEKSPFLSLSSLLTALSSTDEKEIDETKKDNPTKGDLVKRF